MLKTVDYFAPALKFVRTGPSGVLCLSGEGNESVGRGTGYDDSDFDQED